MLSKLVVALVIETLHGRILDGSVHPLDLTVSPGVPHLGRAVLNVVFGAGELESMSPEAFAVCDGLLDQRHGGATGSGSGELNAIIREHRMDFIGNGRDQAQQKLPRYCGGGLFVQFDESELGGAVDRYEHMELALFGPHLGNIDVEEADRVALELLL